MKIIQEDENYNKIIINGSEKELDLVDSKINFHGHNNVLICEDNVKLVNSLIDFRQNNSIIYLSSSINNYNIMVSVNNNSVLFIGKNNYMNGRLNLILSESKHIFIGNDCLFSFGLWFRLADPHLIYDINSMTRINPSKSIFIGDHVWIGQDSMILKGTQIGSGSIIGAKSLVSNKIIPSNTIYAGNPVKEVRKNVFFDSHSVHAYVEKDTLKSMNYDSNRWIYEDDGNIIKFDDIDELFNSNNFDEIIEFLVNLNNEKLHNRFFID
ncbi:acyltransferase [Methanosphaera sp. WGK6]|uniref:acyltransferase n=1 Tax=Methanosphaera sp. WGK6 TaxID=1561964 RepID=UPI00084CB760|nr:acyltransferase [Methanosphaera sp. WGK6]